MKKPTERQTEQLQLLSRGMVMKQVADAMGISVHCVRIQMHRIYKRTGFQTVAHAVAEAVRHGWIE